MACSVSWNPNPTRRTPGKRRQRQCARERSPVAPRFFDVPRGREEHLRVVAELPQRDVARATQESADPSCDVTMVDAARLSSFTDRASVALRRHQASERRRVEVVEMLPPLRLRLLRIRCTPRTKPLSLARTLRVGARRPRRARGSSAARITAVTRSPIGAAASLADASRQLSLGPGAPHPHRAKSTLWPPTRHS